MQSLIDLILKVPIWLQYLIAALVLLATIGLPLPRVLGLFGRWPMHKLWPGREGWGAECIPPESPTERVDMRANPNRAWQGSPAERWTQMREMRKGDYYQLHIHKPRVISRIQVDTEQPLRCPLKYKLQIKERDMQDWKDSGEHEYPIDILFDKPQKLIAMKFIITEPRLEPRNVYGQSPAWSIYDIRLTEARLFGKWWGKVI